MSISQSAIIADKEAEIERLSALANERFIQIAAKDAEIAALRDEFNEVNSQLAEAAGMAFRYKSLLNDALWWLRKHNRHADLRTRIEKELSASAALEMIGGVK